MLETWQRFIATPVVWGTALFAIALNIVTWGVLLLNISPQEGLVVLHYTLYFGVDRVGNWYEVFLIPAFGALLLVINLLFARYFFYRFRAVSLFFLFLTPVMEALLLLAAIFIVIANLPARI